MSIMPICFFFLPLIFLSFSFLLFPSHIFLFYLSTRSFPLSLPQVQGLIHSSPPQKPPAPYVARRRRGCAAALIRTAVKHPNPSLAPPGHLLPTPLWLTPFPCASSTPHRLDLVHVGSSQRRPPTSFVASSSPAGGIVGL
jgi:hypothetical protein